MSSNKDRNDTLTPESVIGPPLPIPPHLHEHRTLSSRSPSPAHSFEMDDSATLSRGGGRAGLSSLSSSQILSERNVVAGGDERGRGQEYGQIDSAKPAGMLAGVARHTLGLILLLCVVFLWTLSNFLGSSIFADNSYAKPFFLTYLNTSIFIFAMLPSLTRSCWKKYKDGTLKPTARRMFSKQTLGSLVRNNKKTEQRTSYRDDEDNVGNVHAGRGEQEAFLQSSRNSHDESEDLERDIPPAISNTLRSSPSYSPTQPQVTGQASQEDESLFLGLVPTARLSLTFCILWFGANYFAMACLQHTTVASATILTSTSSVWTLLIGALTRTEKFTWRKLCGVMGSLTGIVLISRVDFSGTHEEADHPSLLLLAKRALDAFPDKSVGEIALGDFLALLSAIVYGFYTIVLKRTTMSALPLSLNMPLFFGLVGLFNMVLLLPLFPILHFTGAEPFALPPTGHIWMILLVNSISSFVSDIAWAYAMVFTSPLVVTVGLSLTIPLSLVGEMFIQGRYEGWVYWVGAMVVVGSFVFVEREEVEEKKQEEVHEEALRRSLCLEQGEYPHRAVRHREIDDISQELLDDEDETDIHQDYNSHRGRTEAPPPPSP